MINKDNNAINTIKYPRIWEYLIITSNKDELQEKIKEKFHTLEYKFEFSKESKGGKYSSYNFSIYVINQNQRDEIFQILSNIKDVKAVI